MAEVRRVVIVCGYGCHLNRELNMYLEKVCQHLQIAKPGLVILCGGFTQRKTAPGLSEARVMADFIGGYVKEGLLPRFAVILEEDSYTSLDNIRGAYDILKRNPAPEGFEDKITIFCEASRALKVAILARHYFGFPPVTIETVSWELMHPTKELVSTIYDWASLRIPWLASRWRKKRLKRAEQI